MLPPTSPGLRRAAEGKRREREALLESAREDMRRAAQLQREADEETVDRFTRHAGSGFFGNSGDFVLDGDY